MSPLTVALEESVMTVTGITGIAVGILGNIGLWWVTSLLTPGSSWLLLLSSSSLGLREPESMCFLRCLIMLCLRVKRLWQMSHSKGLSPTIMIETVRQHSYQNTFSNIFPFYKFLSCAQYLPVWDLMWRLRSCRDQNRLGQSEQYTLRCM